MLKALMDMTAAAGRDWQLIALPDDDPASAHQNALTAHAHPRPRR
ncbi:hypothetical protein [Nonomuraea bangladeshensis]